MTEGADVVIVGGAVIGSAIAWFLTEEGVDGSVMVVERDQSYERSSTAHTNSCMRQQFSTELNIRMSQFAADYVRDFPMRLGGDPEVPAIGFDPFGYLFLAATDAELAALERNGRIQRDLGVATEILSPDQLASRYAFLNLEGIVGASHNPVDEGYFDGGTMFDWWRKKARQRGVEYRSGEVVGLERHGDRVVEVELATGDRIGCDVVVNASGTRAAAIAAMAGATLPVEARKRYSFVFDAAEPIVGPFPLVIDPTGVHVRRDGGLYLGGCPPDVDPAVDPDDFAVDPDIWEEKLWPALAHRIPAFERIKVTNRWVGHYAVNTFDHNVIVGPHPEVPNFVLANGFSGHGLQHAPAIGRGVAEHIVHGRYRTLDLSPLGMERLVEGRPLAETAVI